MDKNTVIGMVLMCAVIFGFMYLNQPSEEEIAAQQKAQKEQLARQQRETSSAASVVAEADSLSSEDFAMLDSLSRSGAFNSGGIDLKVVDGQLAGTVAVGKKKVDIQSLRSAKSDDPALHNSAINTIKALLDKYHKNSIFASNLSGAEERFILKNDSLEIELSSHGAQITHATLQKYKAYHNQEDYKSNNSEPVQLIADGNNSFGFILNTNTQTFDTRDFYFNGKQESDSTVLMTLNAAGGATWSIRYTLVKDSYMVRMDVLQNGMQRVIPGNIRNMDIAWSQQMRRQEVGKNFEERNSALYYKVKGDGGDVENLSESGNKDEDTQERLKWISAKSQFFSTVLIANEAFNGAQLRSTSIDDKNKNYNKYVKTFDVATSVDYDSGLLTAGSFYFYFGPNKYKVLSSYDKFSPNEDLKLTRLVSLGWTLFRWINTGIIIPVFNWLGNFGWSYGIIILILTILLKLVLSPLTFKSYTSQAKMKILQPDIKEINDKYPNQEDALKRQQKTMELYSRAGANPMGGCLPMLLQMPILIAMFWFFPSSIELRGQSFLWAPDLSAPDAIISLPFSIPFLGDHLSIFCLVMTVTNIAYTYLTMQSQSSNQMPGMKWMMYMMPLMFLFFFNQYASGLSYYYFVSLLLTIAQTYLCRMMVSEDKVRAVMAENAKKPKKKKSGFMARLEEAQRMQQQQMREQQKRNNRRR